MNTSLFFSTLEQTLKKQDTPSAIYKYLEKMSKEGLVLHKQNSKTQLLFNITKFINNYNEEGKLNPNLFLKVVYSYYINTLLNPEYSSKPFFDVKEEEPIIFYDKVFKLEDLNINTASYIALWHILSGNYTLSFIYYILNQTELPLEITESTINHTTWW